MAPAKPALERRRREPDPPDVRADVADAWRRRGSRAGPAQAPAVLRISAGAGGAARAPRGVRAQPRRCARRHRAGGCGELAEPDRGQPARAFHRPCASRHREPAPLPVGGRRGAARPVASRAHGGGDVSRTGRLAPRADPWVVPARPAPRALRDSRHRGVRGRSQLPRPREALSGRQGGRRAERPRPLGARARPRSRVGAEGPGCRSAHSDRRRRRPARGSEGPSLSPRRLARCDPRLPRRASAPGRRRQPARGARGPGQGARHRAVGDLHRLPRRRRAHARRHRRARAALPLRMDAAHRDRGRRHGAAGRGHGGRRHTRSRGARRHWLPRPARQSSGAEWCAAHAAGRPGSRAAAGRDRPAAHARTVRSRTAGGGHGRRVQERGDEVMTVELLFWLTALVVGYAYVGYPLIVAFVARWGTPPRRALSPRPRLSVIVAAYNEARVIEAKIRSALEQSYPADRLEVIVVSDGSTDGTDERVRGFADRRVRLVRQEPRAGKSLALNRGVSVARGDLLIFTDANALFGPDSLARLAAGFHDPRVGLVSGQGLYVAGDAEAPRAVGNGYVRYEAFIKTREGMLGFVAGADGAIYALRREIYRDLGPAEVNDLLHPIQASLEGYASRCDGHAFTMEPPST